MSDEKNLNQVPEEEEGAVVITLTDENGEEVNFEFIDLVEYQGKEYVVLLPMEETEDEVEDVIIYEVVPCDDDTELYKGLESEEELQAVFEIFKERNEEFFNFVD